MSTPKLARHLRMLVRVALCLLILASMLLPAHTARAQEPITHFALPLPTGSHFFGENILMLPNGNFVVADSGWNSNRGAVYLYDGETLEIISRLEGNAKGNQVGLQLVLLKNGNFVVRSRGWIDVANVLPAGAVTWGHAETGFIGGGGPISPENSLVGARSGDLVYAWVVPLTNGNFLVAAPDWDDNNRTNVGAVAWANGETGIVGFISSENSLIGSTTFDYVGSPPPVALTNGNYVVRANAWDNAGVLNAGAVAWGNGTEGSRGHISAENALVGSTAWDSVGLYVTPLANGNYVAVSTSWDRGTLFNVGAVTWGSGTEGVTGPISIQNSFVGSTVGDGPSLAIGLRTLPNGNYLITNPFWDHGAIRDVGAATWADGTRGIVGEASPENSLIGATEGDMVGSRFTLLANGNYVIYSPYWSSALGRNAGAATWAHASTGITGTVSAANSLVGDQPSYVSIANAVVPLTNGNYVVVNPAWSSADEIWAGAVTWGDGEQGNTGVISATNSLVGASPNDSVGFVYALENGNYVVSTPMWDNPDAGDPESGVNVGAVTLGNGAGGAVGTLSATGSLIGAAGGRGFGQSITTLKNGNYVVKSRATYEESATFGGYLTVASGITSTTGIMDDANSLRGETPGFQIGSGGTVPLANGHALVRFPYIENPGESGARRGWEAFAWVDGGAEGAAGVLGLGNVMTTTINSLWFPDFAIHPQSDGSYLVSLDDWVSDDGALRGAVHWGSGTAPEAGAIGPDNSLVTRGRTTYPAWIVTLPSGDYLIINHARRSEDAVQSAEAQSADATRPAADALRDVETMLQQQSAHSPYPLPEAEMPVAPSAPAAEDHLSADALPPVDDLLSAAGVTPASALEQAGDLQNFGSLTIGRAGTALSGEPTHANSLLLNTPNSSFLMQYAQSPMHHYLVVGLPTENRVVIAALDGYEISVTSEGEGAGMVIAQAGGILCGATCTAAYPAGVTVRLAALPGPFSAFNAWGGACAGVTQPLCEVTVDAAKSVSATFVPSDAPGNQTSLLPFVGASAGK